MASGSTDRLDRAFAAFEEYSGLFRLTKDVTTYNALLYAVARSKQPNLSNMLTILESMEQSGILPNVYSYSLLMDTMVEGGSTDHCLEIVSHLMNTSVLENSILRSPVLLRTLRRLCVALALQEDWSAAAEIAHLMVTDNRDLPAADLRDRFSVFESPSLPPFFRDRVEHIRCRQTRYH
jgi:Pentatricopeptide repeat domain